MDPEASSQELHAAFQRGEWAPGLPWQAAPHSAFVLALSEPEPERLLVRGAGPVVHRRDLGQRPPRTRHAERSIESRGP